MRNIFCFLVFACSFAWTIPNACAEHLKVPDAPLGFEQQEAQVKPTSLAAKFFTSFAMTVATGGKWIFIPLPHPKEGKLLFRLTSSGNPLEQADEAFSASLYEHSQDTEEQAVNDLQSDMNKLCPINPVKRQIASNGLILIEFKSETCIRSGYVHSVSRFIKGKEGVYQLTYVTRLKTQSDKDIHFWTELLAKVDLEMD